MSEEKRFTNKKLIVVSILLVLFIGATGVLGFSFILVINDNNELTGNYDELYIDYLELQFDFNKLDEQYFILTGEHIELENDFNILVIDLTDMTTERDNLQSALDELQLLYNALETERDELLQDIVDLENTITDLNTQINNLNTQIVDLENTIAGLEDNNEALIQYYENIIIGLQAEINALTTERDGLISDLVNITAERDNLQNELDALQLLYDDLIIERDNLQNLLDLMIATFNALLGDYQILSDANEELQNTYNALLIAYDYITDTIRQSILPVQYSIFAEAVRRYYGDSYLDFHPLNPPKWYWAGFARFCRDMILHDSNQYNYFTTISNAFSDALIFGNETMYLADYIMNQTFYPWLPNWDRMGLTGNELTDIDIIVDWCINEIDYEYDSDIIDGQETFVWDYIKFPVETAFRTKGDCEDQAILTAAYLESCEFETAIVISHDPSHPTYGAFYHGSLWVHIEDPTVFWSLYPDTLLWSIDGGINLWYWADTTWDIPFGSTPTWLQDYIDYNIPLSWDIITLAICDIGGTINTNVGTNLGLTYVTPT